MPVEIKELNIETTVKEQSKSSSDKKVTSRSGLSGSDREMIIREAVKRALEELEYRQSK
jgi:hypothetical protein